MVYPVQLTGLAGRRVLVVGAGSIAARKVEELLRTGASVHVIALEATQEFLPMLDRVSFEQRPVTEADVEGAALVVAATNDRAVNRRVAVAASARDILVNAVDDPDVCTFFASAVVQRGPVSIAIGSGGAAPLIAGRLRRVLEAALPQALENVATAVARSRQLGLRGLAKRGAMLRALADRRLSALIDRGETDAAAARLIEVAAQPVASFERGTVAIIGTGPGAREHLTLAGLDRIHQADVIIHDALVGIDVLAEAGPHARVIVAGRRCGQPGTTQEVLTALMIAEARSGKRVARLHAGDAFLFGRGGEELDALAAAGVLAKMIPGVSAALAAPIAAGIPLTRRGESRGLTIRTGHTIDGYVRSSHVPAEDDTLVVLMGHGGMRTLLAGLIDEGRARDMPAAAISRATQPDQRVVVGTLADLADRVEEADLARPVTFVVGEVARRASVAATLVAEAAA